MITPLALSLIIVIVVEAIKPKPLDWTASFEAQDNRPFGSSALFQLLDNLFPADSIQLSNEPVYNQIGDSSKIKFSNYLFINLEFEPDEYDIEELLWFTKQGGSVFIAAQFFNQQFQDSLNFKIALAFASDSILLKEINNDQAAIFRFKVQGLFSYFDSVDTKTTIIVGHDSTNRPVFAKIKSGSGAFYIHTVPFVFTNYNMLKTPNHEYISATLSVLQPKAIVWDGYYKSGRRSAFKTPLSFILNQASLSWAYYISLAGVILFIFVEGKRKQRPIPVIAPLKNESLSFVDTIGRLYHQNSDHLKMAFIKRSYLYDFIRTRFNLNTAKIDPTFLEKLNQKTNIDFEKLNTLFNKLKSLDFNPNLSNQDFTKLNKLIEDFYNQCKG